MNSAGRRRQQNLASECVADVLASLEAHRCLAVLTEPTLVTAAPSIDGLCTRGEHCRHPVEPLSLGSQCRIHSAALKPSL